MRLSLHSDQKSPVVRVTVGSEIKIRLACLVDTGFTEYLAGFLHVDGTGTMRTSLGNADYLAPPHRLPRSQWGSLADGSRPETWVATVQCEFEGVTRNCETLLFPVAAQQDVPLILGMSFLKLFKADLSLHFSTRTFALDVRR